MRRVPADDDDVVARALRTREAVAAAEELDHVAVCLIGYERPVPIEIGSNRVASPVAVVWSRDPISAADARDRGNPLHRMVTLRYVWTASLQQAKRLKAALDVRILGDDPQMTALRRDFRDLPEWEIAWDILLNDALGDLRANGVAVEVMSDAMRDQRLLNRAREIAMGGRRGRV